MNFNQFVLKNTLRNKSLYSAYFLSVLSTVMSFFTFASFALHPQLGTDLHTAVKVGMATSAIIIYLFSFFFVWNSVAIFIQSRKREFGVLLIQGMSPKQLKKMIVRENLLVGFFATLFGIMVGLLFSQLLLFLSRKFLEVDFAFYLPLKAMGITFLSFLLLFLVISFLVQFKIPRLEIQTLLKSQELGRGQLKPSKTKVLLAVLLIGIGYLVALMAKGPQVVMAMIPVIFVVILGTYFFFNQFSVFMVNRLQGNEKWFWKKTNLLLFSDLAFRMKDNAKAFYLVTVISTVAFSAIGTLVGFKEMTFSGIDSDPYAITLFQSTEETPEKSNENIELIEKSLAREKVTSKAIELETITTQASPESVEAVTLISQKMYHYLAQQLELDEFKTKKLPVVLSNPSEELTQTKKKMPLSFVQFKGETKEKVTPVKTDYRLTSNFNPIVVVSNQTYQKQKDNKDNGINLSYHWFAKAEEDKKLVKIGEKLEGNPDIQIKPYLKKKINYFYSPILFIGFFIGIIFFISAGSFLYFRLYSDIALDREKFLMVYKLGFSKLEMKKVVYQQIGILFFTPMIVSLGHGLVALTAMYALFNQSLQPMALIVLATFLGIQILYYLIARSFYFNKLYREITRIA
ncbi:FtsX-like permease family protein [Vagococcus sp.]|uniref:FtsX-like permease family protein n=1 Tax=Vagococcus sp. TaxID=1933889 RepID=UPI003F9C529D